MAIDLAIKKTEVVSKTIERLFYHFVKVVEWTTYYTIADKDFLLERCFLTVGWTATPPLLVISFALIFMYF